MIKYILRISKRREYEKNHFWFGDRSFGNDFDGGLEAYLSENYAKAQDKTISNSKSYSRVYDIGN
ncbi:hypothetical protein [Campylobacter fetus]|uniref:Uncharacterized protein n=1 Tax=Campylobacter fetus TaxID=196 RepID=A0A5L8W2A3_CAMFE|nr:hypothetical protein [Campylobacter fetus]EAI4414689.1 hypothetical protein [Campylobacter fetus]EAI5407453.1 hypothetical protein [Campylobacter fetus]EAJ0328039.1 hypothetical protein [Campylobacter fetus]EAJ1230401.1 hypothetical protein [Campylobacter fetus]EAJ5693378.1 hypothetical protein [Campylobacter fetus]